MLSWEVESRYGSRLVRCLWYRLDYEISLKVRRVNYPIYFYLLFGIISDGKERRTSKAAWGQRSLFEFCIIL